MNEENVKTQTEPKKAEKKKQPLVCEIFDYIEIFVFAAATVLLLFTFSVRLCTVDGDSMFDTLINGQTLLVNDIFYTPDNNDIIVFHQSDNRIEALNKPLVKRVIATEDQYYRIVYEFVGEDDNRYVEMLVYVSDDETIDENDLIKEDFIDYKQLCALNNSQESVYLHHAQPNEDQTQYTVEGQVPKGMLFVMGDNRFNSTDSRLQVGYVDTRCVLGKVIYRLTPMGTVK